ncbi:hypothetical protein AKL17_3p0053 (plasmid) [Frigidibacter mobilis]|uniref:Uncharacterized protein n=1 Tax=Frigidibacter mobilis TaxID=1335048 RepID=A0A165SXS3_9RHOB|nr:hypothetical protein AKL17_3p0053 [Frigidibacter mobilis]
MVCKDIQLEADPAHPLRHQPPVEVDQIAGINPFLAIERQAVGVFGDRDLRQQRLGRQATFDDVRRARAWMTPSQPLNAYFGRRVTITRNFAGSHPAARRRLPDQHLLLARVLRQVLGLDHHLNPLQMRREALARPGGRFSSEDRPLPTCALRAEMPVSISSKTKACCASSSHSALRCQASPSGARTGPGHRPSGSASVA